MIARTINTAQVWLLLKGHSMLSLQVDDCGANRQVDLRPKDFFAFSKSFITSIDTTLFPIQTVCVFSIPHYAWWHDTSSLFSVVLLFDFGINSPVKVFLLSFPGKNLKNCFSYHLRGCIRCKNMKKLSVVAFDFHPSELATFDFFSLRPNTKLLFKWFFLFCFVSCFSTLFARFFFLFLLSKCT